jgi:hypothetical protein
VETDVDVGLALESTAAVGLVVGTADGEGEA